MSDTKERCPYCGSSDVHHEVDADREGEIYDAYWICDECGEGWRD